MKTIISICTFIISYCFLASVSFAQLASYCQGPVIIMEGEGEVESIPDIAELRISIIANNENETIILNELAENTHKVINILKSINIDEADIQTGGLNISPMYGLEPYPRGNNSEITSFKGSSFVSFKTTNIENIEEIANKVMNGSQNLLSQINFSSSQKEVLLSKAREAAFLKAQNKAEQFTKLSGNRLGEICTITEGDIGKVTDPVNYAVNNYRMSGAAMLSQARIPNIPIKPGKIKTKSKVSIVYQLEN
ncbi:SIMPL domain-containing protein [Pseudemcibacter aquimaris]|uniref:SIMPL domain-containing protein n=1 Tax=Pseudemcibacter aquimaris TaxID=2857064 RepID=UPI002011B768|nr:SIMPL domain-containing protein [Pseudemcibacter aquimaris]MCC3861342.1 SIMPL domain-containing protein [Pseudemcibacter aquimaris]WDU58114.1 SIMPL domain-containing protein [Pseudemcibacter aquimaris]